MRTSHMDIAEAPASSGRSVFDMIHWLWRSFRRRIDVTNACNHKLVFNWDFAAASYFLA
jgi:hypothetical protein